MENSLNNDYVYSKVQAGKQMTATVVSPSCDLLLLFL